MENDNIKLYSRQNIIDFVYFINARHFNKYTVDTDEVDLYLESIHQTEWDDSHELNNVLNEMVDEVFPEFTSIKPNIEDQVYEGTVYQAKDNIVIETRTGPDSVSLAAPIDFIDGTLANYVGDNLKITISISVNKVL